MYTLLLTLQQSSFFRVNSFIWGLRSLMTNEANKVLYIQRRLQKGVTSTTRVPQKCPWNWRSAISGGKEDTGLDSSSVSSPPVSQISRPRPPFMTALLVLAVSGKTITILVLSCPSSPKEKLHQQLQMIRIHYYACVIGNGRTDNICYGKRAYFQHLGVAFKTRFCLRDGAAVLWVFPARIGNKSGENCCDDGPPSFAFSTLGPRSQRFSSSGAVALFIHSAQQSWVQCMIWSQKIIWANCTDSRVNQVPEKAIF